MAFGLSKLTSVFKKDISKRAEHSVIGVDVGTSSIKVVQLHDRHGTVTLDTYGELQLGPYGGVEIGRTVNLQTGKLTEAFIDIIRESSATGTDISLAIPYNATFATIMSVPTTDKERIGPMIPIEARKYIPVPLSQVTLDWFPVALRSDDRSTRVLLVAIHNDAVERYQTMIRIAGLTERFTEIEMFSHVRSSVEQGDNAVAVIDLGAGSTKLYIAKRGVITKTHSVRLGGTELTNTLQSALETDFKTAEELKRRYGLHGLESDERMQRALTPLLERGFREIHKVIMRHKDEEQVDIEKVILTGGGAMLRGIDVYARDMLARPIVIADPFSKVAYPAFLEDTLAEAGPTFGAALGAALRILSFD